MQARKRNHKLRGAGQWCSRNTSPTIRGRVPDARKAELALNEGMASALLPCVRRHCYGIISAIRLRSRNIYLPKVHRLVEGRGISYLQPGIEKRFETVAAASDRAVPHVRT